MRFLNNRCILHGREGFHDDNPSAESKRHLVRLWLRDQEIGWKLPEALSLASARIFEDPERPVRWDIEPIFENGVWQGRGLRAECD